MAEGSPSSLTTISLSSVQPIQPGSWETYTVVELFFLFCRFWQVLWSIRPRRQSLSCPSPLEHIGLFMRLQPAAQQTTCVQGEACSSWHPRSWCSYFFWVRQAPKSWSFHPFTEMSKSSLICSCFKRGVTANSPAVNGSVDIDALQCERDRLQSRSRTAPGAVLTCTNHVLLLAQLQGWWHVLWQTCLCPSDYVEQWEGGSQVVSGQSTGLEGAS